MINKIKIISGCMLFFITIIKVNCQTSGINFQPNVITVPETVLVKGGTFKLGSEDGEVNEKPVHTVIVSDFYIGKYEVTNKEFCEFLNDKGNNKEKVIEWINLSGKWDDDTLQKCNIYLSEGKFWVKKGYEDYPVTFVNWYGAKAYCDWLSEKTGKQYRLPTETEWEYVARNCGQNIKYVWGNEPPVGKHPGNFADESLKRIYPDIRIAPGYNDLYVFVAPVGKFEPNVLGIYDLAGNVWEWCSDWFSHQYDNSDGVKNPVGAKSGDMKVARGGSWLDGPGQLRVSRRVGLDPKSNSLNLGFRVAMEK